MISIDFGVTSLKAKSTGTLNVRMVFAYYLENYLSQSLHILHRVIMSKVKVTEALNVRIISVHLVKSFSQSPHFYILINHYGFTGSKVKVFIFHILIGYN
jgi:hypothetical protein